MSFSTSVTKLPALETCICGRQQKDNRVYEIVEGHNPSRIELLVFRHRRPSRRDSGKSSHSHSGRRYARGNWWRISALVIDFSSDGAIHVRERPSMGWMCRREGHLGTRTTSPRHLAGWRPPTAAIVQLPPTTCAPCLIDNLTETLPPSTREHTLTNCAVTPHPPLTVASTCLAPSPVRYPTTDPPLCQPHPRTPPSPTASPSPPAP